MLEAKKELYKKAYTELNEVFKLLTEDELNKIPKQFIENVQKEMDTEYIIKHNRNKSLLEQELMVETKALIVDIYKKYLCPQNEKEMWKKYDDFCKNKIEEEKRKKYNTENLFENKEILKKEETQNTDIMECKKENIFKRIINKLKNKFKKNK